MSAQNDPARDARDRRAVELAQERLRWYRREARKARLGYQYLELAQLVAGALVPVGVAVGWDAAVTASLGAAVVLAGGARAVFRWHDNWLGFIGAQMQIERELALYEVGASPYADTHRGQTLVREVERIALEETQGWRARRQADREAAASDAPDRR
ncbi:MAG TPA: DUF4231 domain-containing protein [Solirubrobacteraceae bacterium]|jgi:hypothetical protein